MQVSSARHITGNFNAHLQDCVVLFADEAFWAGDKQSEGTLKTLITEDIIPIERKGLDVQQVPNHVHLLIASNNEWVIPAGEMERRFFVLEVGEENMQDHAFFEKMQKEMDDGGYEAFLHYLRQLDLSDFDVRQVPRTEALAHQMMQSLSPEESWWYYCLSRGCLHPSQFHWEEEVDADYVFESYLMHCDEIGRTRSKLDRSTFGKFLGRMTGHEGIRKKRNVRRRKEVMERGIRRERTSNCTLHIYPPLAKCRDIFCQRFGITLDWPDEADAETSVEDEEIPF